MPTHEASNSPKLFARGVISGAADESSPTFTPDGKTVFFTRGNGSGSMIMVARLGAGGWSEPTIAPFSGVWNDLEPAMAPDGTFLVFASNRPARDGTGPLDGRWDKSLHPRQGGNLWRVDREGSGWGEPHRLPDTINADNGTFSPSVTADHSIYFMRPSGDQERFRIFRSQHAAEGYSTAVPVDLGDASKEVVDPAVAPDESFIVFSANDPERHDPKRLKIAFRTGAGWAADVDLGDEVNEKGSNIEARLGPDHTTLFFSTNTVPPADFPRSPETAQRDAADMTTWANGRENIWFVSLNPWLNRRVSGGASSRDLGAAT